MPVSFLYEKHIIMKKLLLLLFILVASLACEHECDNQTEICNETVPNEDCEAYFVRWFYNSRTNACTEIGYSGCEHYGFATQAECETCLCVE